MDTCLQLPGSTTDDLSSDALWINLYTFLQPYVRRLVYTSGIATWRGQEDDIVDDIVQEAIVRVLKCIRRAESGEGIPVASPEGLSIVIARNYYEDLRRRDRSIGLHPTDAAICRNDSPFVRRRLFALRAAD